MDTSKFYPIEPEQGPPPYTPEEIRQLDDFARQTGLKIFPVSVKWKGKQPCCKDWLNKATSEPAKLFGSYTGQTGRFGMPCKSNGFLVIDCDVKEPEKWGNGVEQFQAYCERNNLPLSPVWQSTPSGGRHYFYKADYPESIRGRTKIELEGNPTNIDIRSPGAADGDGNYIVSDLSGRSGYEWHGNWSQIPSLPRRLVEELKEEPQEISGHVVTECGEVPERIVQIVRKRLAEIAQAANGERNDTVYKLSCKICRWLLPYPGEWEKWEPRILEAALKTGLPQNEARTAIEQGRKGGVADGPFSPERYQDEGRQAEEQQNGENGGSILELPKEAFSENLWRLINALAEKCSTSREVALANLLALGAECLGYNRYIRINNQNEQRSNLWIVVIASPGTGKTTCFNTVTRRLREIDSQMREEREQEVIIWEEWQRLPTKEKKLRIESGEQPPKYPKAVGLIARDTTIEAMLEVFESEPRSILNYADEMRGFFGSYRRYQSNDIGSANSDTLLGMYDSSPISVWRKTKDYKNHHIFLSRATMTLMGNIQPGLVKKLFSRDDFDQGWPQRCCFVISSPPKPLLYPPPRSAYSIDAQKVDDDIRMITDRLWAVGSQECATVIDKECEQYLAPYSASLYYDFMEPPLSKLQAFARRFHWTSFRILHVLLFLEWALSPGKEVPKSLSALQAYRGILLCRWLITNTVSIFQGNKGAGDPGQDSEQDLRINIAKIVVGHEKEIVAEDCKVPSSVFREWLKDAGFGDHADQFFTKTLNSMGITAGKARKIINGANKPVSVKTFSDATLALCRKLAKPAPLLFERLNGLVRPSEQQPETRTEEAAAPEESIAPSEAAQPETKIATGQLQEDSETSLLVTDYSNPHDFTHLHLHTDGSLQDAMLTVDEAIEQARKCNMTSLAITDHGNLHNAYKFYLAARAAGIHPVLGCEIYIKNDGLFPPPPEGKKAKASFHLTLLAETQKGWENLLALQVHSSQNLYRDKPLVTHEFLASHAQGLIGMSACLGGEVAQAILQGHDPKPVLDWYQKTFGENSFFLERMENGYPELGTVNPRLCALSQECGLPIVGTADVHYLAPEDREAYLVHSMQKWQIKQGESVAERGREPWSLHFRTAEEMRVAHGNRIEELELSGKIAARCNVELPEPGKGKVFMPPNEAIVGYGNDASGILKEKAFAGLSALGLADKPEYAERLEYELGIITQKGFENYILMIADMIEEARRKDIAVGPGRGSGPGSLVCYALGITRLDPIQNGLLFERFINPDRVSLPDIDVDYDDERRGEILEYLRAKYGEKCVAAIGTIGTCKGKTAIRDAVKNLQNDKPSGMAQKDWTELGNKLAACVPDDGKTIPELAHDGAFAGHESPEASRILGISARLEGLSRQAGQHACGYVVSPHPLETAIPLRTGKEGPLVTQWTKDEIEAAGYVKLDALGSLTLTRIRKAIGKIRAAGKPEPSFAPDDSKTYDLLKSGETAGIFQMTGDGMRSLVRKIKPRTLQDITVAIALFRPGPLNSGMVEHFLKRRNGKEEVTYFGLDEELRPILEETCGVIVYQEQVMRIAQAVAGFSPVEADALRAAMSKKRMDAMEEKKALFITGAMQKGLSEEKASELFGMMEKFAEYGFNKSHAAAYAMLSWQTAYLKANYPAEFLAACCETTDDNMTPRNIAAECKRLGLDRKDLPTNCDLAGFGEHPLKAYGDKGDDLANLSEVAKGQHVSIRVYAENVYQTEVKNGYSKGKPMGMGNVSDETGTLPFVSFPDAWSSCKIKKGKCYILIGEIKLNKDKKLQIVVEKAEELRPKAAATTRTKAPSLKKSSLLTRFSR